MLVLSLFAVAWAALPVYLHNAESNSPANAVVDSGHADVLASHFVGLQSDNVSPEALAIAHYVPSVLLDERNAAVVVITGFDANEALPMLGSPAFYIDEEASVKDTSDYVAAGASAGSDAIKAIKQIDNSEYPVIAVSAANSQDDLIEAVSALKSKVLLIGVPSGSHTPDLPYDDQPKLKYKPRIGKAAGSVVNAAAAGSHSKSVKPNTAQLRSLPSFFASEEDCARLTNDCSGRGQCVANGEYYVCACKPTKENGYTYNWGGPACAKQDISWQFHLLLWTTIGIIAAGTAGVVLLFGIGSEPLPGILGSGQPGASSI